MAQVQQISEQNCPVQASQWFCFIAPQHVQEPNTVPPLAGQRYHSTPVGPMETFWRPWELSKPPIRADMYFSGLLWNWMSWTHPKIAYISAWKTEPFSHRLPIDSAPVPYFILDPSVNQTSPLTTGGVPVPLVQSSLVNIVTLYLGSKLNADLISSTPILNMGSDCWSRINMLLCPRLGCR